MRMRIVLAGLNHRTASLALRERVAFSAEAADRASQELRSHWQMEEVVVLSTCNRSEIYAVNREGSEPGAIEAFLPQFHAIPREQLNGSLYSRRDGEAILHLFRVAAGLDSMLLGEAEILGQVREAYRRAADSGATGPILNRLFQSAIEAGRRVRSETELGARPMSAASAGVRLAERIFGNLEAHESLILGSGEMAEQAVENFRQRGIKRLRIASRTRDHALSLAERFGVETLAWEELPRELAHADILVSSVSSPEPVISHAMLAHAMAERKNRSMLAIDLGVPRNIESDASSLYNFYLYHLDDLTEIVDQNRKAREREVPRAEAILSAQISKFEAWYAGRGAAGAVDDLRLRLDARRRRMLETHAHAFAHLGPEDREKIDRLTAELLEELLKAPSSRLRHARSWRERVQQIETLRGLFDLDSEDES